MCGGYGLRGEGDRDGIGRWRRTGCRRNVRSPVGADEGAGVERGRVMRFRCRAKGEEGGKGWSPRDEGGRWRQGRRGRDQEEERRGKGRERRGGQGKG